MWGGPSALERPPGGLPPFLLLSVASGVSDFPLEDVHAARCFIPTKLVVSPLKIQELTFDANMSGFFTRAQMTCMQVFLTA